MKRLWKVVAAIASVVALVAVPAAYAGYTSAKLEVTQAGKTTTIKLSVDPNDDPTAMLQIQLGSGTRVTTNQAPGTALGPARAVVRALDLGGADLPLEGHVVVTAPGQVSAAVQEACIGRTRPTATWVLALSGAAGQQLALPVYFVPSPGWPGNIYVCVGPPDVPVGTPGRAPFGAKLSSLEATLTGVFRTVSAGTWLAGWSPYTPLVGEINFAGGVASPAAIAPGAVTLTARRVGTGANLVGRVTQSGAGRSATVTIVGGSASGKLRTLGRVRVAANGAFTFRASAGTFFRARAVAAPEPAPTVCQQLYIPMCVNPTVSGFTAQSRVVRVARQQPSVRLFRAWLAAFNSGDRRRYARFLRRSFPSRVYWLNQDMGLREFTGGFVLRRLGRMSATWGSGWVQERDSDQFVRFVLTVATGTPRKILSLDLVPQPRPAEFPIARLTEGEAVAAVETLLRKRAAADRFSGAALMAKDGRILFSSAYGLADRERGISNTLETRFRIGSMNKMFTAVAALQLVEAGKLALDDPVGKHLRGYPNRDVASKVTVRHLLTHTGGTGDIFGPQFDRNRLTLREHGDYVKLYGSRPPRFEPGSRFEYSNYGFVLLGALIEAVSGESYYDYVRENVFRPAGMSSTDSLPESEPVPNRSIGYLHPYFGARSWQPNTGWLPWRGTAAGGGYSTVGDLARFAEALTSHELLSPGSTELLLAGKIDLGYGFRYAFGFFDSRDESGNGWVGHGGGAPGMNGDLRIYPRSGYVVAVLANFDPPAAQRITDYLDPRLPTSSDAARAPEYEKAFTVRGSGDRDLNADEKWRLGWLNGVLRERWARYGLDLSDNVVTSFRVTAYGERMPVERIPDQA